MAKLRAHSIAVSLDGYAAGPDQSLEHPIGVGGQRLHEWVFATAYGARMLGRDGGTQGVDDALLRRGDEGVGATIMGRNMFGPIRGRWSDGSWTGWWGDDPPYHHAVFVLTHHFRPPVQMKGGTTFHFVTDGIESALRQAVDAAGGLDVRLGGSAATIQQYLRAGLLDELHVAIVPVLLGSGERLFDGLDGGAGSAGTPDYACVEVTNSPSVAHIRLARKG